MCERLCTVFSKYNLFLNARMYLKVHKSMVILSSKDDGIYSQSQDT
jgi:hypothetical protein